MKYTQCLHVHVIYLKYISLELLAKFCRNFLGRQNSLFGIVTRQVGWFWFRFLAGTRYFYLLQNVETGLQVHSTSYSMATRSYFPGVKWSGHAVAHSYSSIAELKNSLRHVRDNFMCFTCFMCGVFITLNCLSSLSNAWSN
jgi:hypothetical protein